ncbi:glycohydrolase toxin TNT-related protein [Micromonospora sp. WMMD1102]|uniref:glycohydrolase toxin TNT-related protein n=1 Tax=Micromonospora sp. WMMD1102 TaxID=3016105 RepID=UPI002414E800|nr:glycohydrolase toxin TNT-related protein [Micromonospora sp. WMMD1102]MDG4791750.1 glycohydrolase toxin TNT-related protein [Micromonospora sp. WMMD1102]
MSEPWATQARQHQYNELLQQIGAALVGAVPQGWRRLDLTARIAEGVQDFGLTVIMSDFSSATVDPPAQAAWALAELRKLMYHPERGAWLSARYLMNPPGEFRIFYNYDHDPLWDPPIPPAAFHRDLAAYPRPAERVPGWLLRVIEPAGASPGGPTPTGATLTAPDGRDPRPRHPTPLGLEDQRNLQRQIADLLVIRAPADRDQIRVMYRAAGNHEEMVGHILGIDGQLREWEPPRELPEYYRQLRAGMHKHGVGAWSGASTVVEYPIKTSINYLFDEDPRWRQPPPRTAVLDELEMFPRKPEHVPSWMKTVLPNAERVAEVADRFRRGRIFDHRDAGGRPVVDRPPVPEADVQRVLEYLNTAHVIMGGRGFDPDVYDPNSARDVPSAFHTDGTWIWPASVPHYLAKHGVPPEPDLVAHIRANGFAPPQLDQATKNAAYIALTGEVPAAPPRQAPVATPAEVAGAQRQAPATAPTQVAAQPGQASSAASTDLSDRERRTLAVIDQRVSEMGAVPAAYRLLDSAEGATCLERVGDEWQVADYERGRPRNPRRFTQLWEAGAYLLGTLTIHPSRLRAGGRERNTPQTLNDWPIQPLPGEPPLTLLAQKRIAVLMPGREIVRYGPPTGNLTFAAGTPFSAMSLRSEREQQGPSRYRVLRELRTLSGEAVPWHGQPGGGTAYLLTGSVEQHLANGSLAELTGEAPQAVEE